MRILALAIVLAVTGLAAVGHKLSGVVTDPSGAAIAEATVEVFDPGAKTEAQTITDENGKFTIQALPSDRTRRPYREERFRATAAACHAVRQRRSFQHVVAAGKGAVFDHRRRPRLAA
jgi:hypothetical protein